MGRGSSQKSCDVLGVNNQATEDCVESNSNVVKKNTENTSLYSDFLNVRG